MTVSVDKATGYVVTGAGDNQVGVGKATGYLITGAGPNQVGLGKVTGYAVIKPHPEVKAMLVSADSGLKVRLNDGVRSFKILVQE